MSTSLSIIIGVLLGILLGANMAVVGWVLMCMYLVYHPGKRGAK
jgi:hypothetical protein